MTDDSEGEADPKVSFRISEANLDLIRSIASDDDSDYSQSHIIRYSLDRKFEDRDSWEPHTSKDPELENLFEDYADLDSDDETVSIEDVSGMLEEDLRQDAFEYAMTIYNIGVKNDDEELQELTRQYLENNFSEKMFTEYLKSSE